MRKSYLDNIRWVTVVSVVFFHVLYMYNGEGIAGTLGKITSLEVQYYDAYMYIVYPWFMVILFIVSGISARLYLDNHTDKEFLRTRTTKLLVPCTIGIVVFHFIQGYINMSFGDVGSMDIPAVIRYFIMLASGIGVLWYIQMLWLFSMVLILVRKIEKNRLLNIGKKTNLPALILLSLAFYGAGQILNTPIICVYRFGLYFTAFIIGYYVFSHDEVIDILKKWLGLFCPVAIALGAAFCIKYFGQNYADKPVNRSPLFLFYSYFACLAMLGGFARLFDSETKFTKWMSTHSFGLYVFHYLGISAVALFLTKNGLISPLVAYVLSLIAGFACGYGLYAIISRIPFFRWAVLGISAKK